MIQFLNFGLKDLIDIFLVAILLYYVYRLMKQSRSINIFSGIIIFLLVWLLVSQILEMKLLGSILDKLVSYGVIALIILFQDEIRKFLTSLGNHHRVNRLFRWFTSGNQKKNIDKQSIMPVVMACMNMARGKVGALIVFERNMPLADVIKTGETINANINQRLIENIFFKNSPLHDGAMIIRGKRIEAAGCILPVSHDTNIPKTLGLRHRAALGISQESDALAIVVSEETGYIATTLNGEFRHNLSAEELESLLTNSLSEVEKE